MREIEVIQGEFYRLTRNRVLRIEDFKDNPNGRRTNSYFTGTFLRLDEMTIGYDTEGHPYYDVGKRFLTAKQKEEIRKKFEDVGKIDIFREFFHMR